VAAAGLRLWASVIGWRLRVGSTAGCEVRLTAHAGWPGQAGPGQSWASLACAGLAQTHLSIVVDCRRRVD